MTELWADEGPVSQGKILTAIMQDKRAEAEDMLRSWTVNDLIKLASAATMLEMLALQAQQAQDRRRWRS
jgi:hypothetical protein